MNSDQDQTEQQVQIVLPHCKFDNSYEIVSIDRRQIKNADYNPRVITPKAKEKLKKFLQKRGLLAPITWNKRTGNIVGGHKRLACLDALMGSDAYTIRVAAVDLDDKNERESNVFLNNKEAQGDWDLEALEKMIREDNLDIEEAGFDLSDIYALLGDSPLADSADKLAEMSDKLRDARDVMDKMRKSNASLDDLSYYAVVVFKSSEDREQFNEAIGVSPEQYYIDGRYVWNYLKMNGLVTENDDSDGVDTSHQFMRTVKECPRCSAKHDKITFFRFSERAEGEFTHYGLCPSTTEPILVIPSSKELGVITED